jgi:catechol O-methyltransferase
MPYQESK